MFLACQVQGGEVTQHKSTIGIADYSGMVGVVINFECEGVIGFDGELWYFD